MMPFLMVIATALLKFIPEKTADMIAKILSLLWYILDKKRRNIVKENIEIITGKKDWRLIKNTFLNFGYVYKDILNIPNITANNWGTYIRGEGIDNLGKGLKRGKGLILVGAHLGAWEIAGPYLASRGYPLFVVAESKGPGMRFFNFYRKYREKFGPEVIRLEEKNIAINILSLLKKNKVIPLIADRDISGTGRVFRFFGKNVKLPIGPAYISKKSGAPICIGFMVRKERGYYGYIFPPIYPENESIEGLMQKIINVFEREITKYPDQWFVFERVWNENINNK